MSRAAAKVVEFSKHAEEPAVLDPHIVGLALDSLGKIEAFITSRIAGLPYPELRDALRLDGEEKAAIAERAQAVAARYPGWLAEHGDAALLLVGLMAAQIAHLDAALAAAGDPDPARPAEAKAQLFWGLVFVLLPVLLFLVIYFFVKGKPK